MSSVPVHRLGIMVPSSNTVMETDFWRGVGGVATLHTARMYMEDTTPEGEARMLDEFALPAARDVGTAKPDVVVFGCTSAGALRGNDYDAELCRRISDVTGAPTVSTIQAVRHAVLAAGSERVAVITPYIDELNVRIRASLEADGVEVATIAGLGITDNFHIAMLSQEAIIEHAVRTVEGHAVDLLFASCTNMPAFAARSALVDRLGIPVVTSNQAVLEAALERLGAMDAGAMGTSR
ncbi:MAG: aspartate/glutamate racemase family protein [Actinomycetota bacterium]|nr:aspartate/glutamate racemase family protein [Actinomycetota bacterium]